MQRKKNTKNYLFYSDIIKNVASHYRGKQFIRRAKISEIVANKKVLKKRKDDIQKYL
jgi:hypothetical protein